MRAEPEKQTKPSSKQNDPLSVSPSTDYTPEPVENEGDRTQTHSPIKTLFGETLREIVRDPRLSNLTLPQGQYFIELYIQDGERNG